MKVLLSVFAEEECYNQQLISLTNLKVNIEKYPFLAPLTGYLPMSQKVAETQNRQFFRNLCHSTLSWSRLTNQNIFDL